MSVEDLCRLEKVLYAICKLTSVYPLHNLSAGEVISPITGPSLKQGTCQHRIIPHLVDIP